MVRATASVISELEDAMKAGSPERRVETLRRVTELFLNDADRLNEQQIEVFDDILVHLIQRMETKALVQLSTRLAPIDNAPNEVVRRLARDSEIAVAGPMLTQSNRLTSNDLVEIAQSMSQRHLLAISGRSSLSETVTDVLVERGDRDVTHRLAKNAGARFSQSGFATLVTRAEHDERLAESVGLRLDIPLQLLRQLIARATEAVRNRLMGSASPERRQEIERALASVANDLSREAAKPRDYSRAEMKVREINRKGMLNEAAILNFACEGQHDDMIVGIGLLSGAPTPTVEALAKNSRHDGMLVACRAANLGWPTVCAILKSQLAHRTVSDQELDAAKRSFSELTLATAQRTLRFMLVQQAAKKS